MKPESRPSSEQGLDSAVNLAGLITSSPRHPYISTPLLVDLFVAEVSSLCISSVCSITLCFPQPNRETALRAVTKEVVGIHVPVESQWGDSNPSPFIKFELDQFLKGYYRNLQQSQPSHIEIVGEKNTIQTIVRRVASDYCIPYTIGRGYCSTAPKKKLVERFKKSGKASPIVLVRF
jgi:hypothetical protein